MAQEKPKKTENKSQAKNEERKKSAEKKKEKKKDDVLTKVVIRRLPPSWAEDTVLEQLAPIPDHDYFHFARADHSLGQHAFSRAYINFLNHEDILVFKEKFDGYVFLDSKGNEYPAIVEFAPFPKKPKRTQRKADARCGTVEQDTDYQKFLETITNPVVEPVPPPETILEEIENREKELKVSHGVPKLSTPLLDYIKKKKEDKKAAILKAREERKKREIERRRLREEDKRKQKEREKQLERKRQRRLEQQEKENEKKAEMSAPTKVVLLKNPEREKEHDSGSAETSTKSRGKEVTKSGSASDNHGKETKTEAKSWNETGSSRNRDYNSRTKGQEGSGRQRERESKTRYKPAPRETKWKDQEADHARDPDRERDQNRYRDSAKGSRRDPESERTKSRPGRFERDDAKNDEQSTEKSSDRSGISSKEACSRERPLSYQKRREEYRERKAGKSSEKLEKTKADYLGGKDQKADNRSEERHAKNISQGERSDKDDTESRAGGSAQEKNNVLPSSQTENTKDSETKEESAKETKGRKIRYRDRPERAIYNPAQRVAQRRKEQEARSRSKDSPETSRSPEGGSQAE